jgi:intracellular sulfur oxidation DsrE/DsrF family protein
MSEKRIQPAVARRVFLSRVGRGVGLIGATFAASPALQAQSAASWQPARHEQDDWYDQIPGKHRFVFDTTSPEGLATGMQFANNFFEANKSGYGLQDSDLAVILIVRHKSTAFGYNDAIWAKYSAELSKQAVFVDPKTKEAPVVNTYATPGGRMEGLIKRGVHVAICQMATRAIAGQLARATNGTQDAVYAELSANLVTNARLVPAGILAVNRAQERGYSFVAG